MKKNSLNISSSSGNLSLFRLIAFFLSIDRKPTSLRQVSSATNILMCAARGVFVPGLLLTLNVMQAEVSNVCLTFSGSLLVKQCFYPLEHSQLG